MLAIINKELKHYFKTPLGYVFIGFVLILFGILFTFNLYSWNGDYTQVVGSQLTIIFVLFFGTPLITMKLMSEEKRLKTDQLLITAPISIIDLVVAKYLAAILLFLFTVAITIFQPIVLSRLGAIPVAKIAGTYFGFILLGCALISIGLFISSLAGSQMIAAIVTYIAFFGILFSDSIVLTLPKDRTSSILFAAILVVLIVFIIYLSVKNVLITFISSFIGIAILIITYLINPLLFDGFIIHFFGWFSLMTRFESFYLGILDLSSIIYYLSIAAIFVFLSIQVIEKRRWS